MRISQKRMLCVAMSLVILAIAGCAKTPVVRVWEPWTRVLGDASLLVPGEKVSVKVSGETEPLLGQESLLQGELAHRLSQALVRRGYQVVDGPADVECELIYKTSRTDKVESLSMSEVSAYQGAYVSSQYSPLSVEVARMVAAAVNKTTSQTYQSSRTVTAYVHTISLVMKDPKGITLWKGDATWDSGGIDALQEFQPAQQILLSSLPASPKEPPTVPEVVEDRAPNYFRLHCQDRQFRSAALPYSVSFPLYFSNSIKDPQLLRAYVDLITNSETALPRGSSDYKKPLDRIWWSSVRLGGSYVLSPSGEKVNVLVELRGYTSGYLVTKCWRADEKEFAQFKQDLGRWQSALTDYFNVYRK